MTNKKFENFFLTGIAKGSKGCLKITVENDSHVTKHKILRPQDELGELVANFKNAAISFLFPHTVTDQVFRDNPYIGIESYNISERQAACARIDFVVWYAEFLPHITYNSVKMNINDVRIDESLFDMSQEEYQPSAEENQEDSEEARQILEAKKAQAQAHLIRFRDMYKALRELNDFVEDNYEKILETPNYQGALFGDVL